MKTLKDFKKDINKDKNLKERFMRLKNKEEATKLKEKLETIELEFKVKTGKDDKVFGSISPKQIKEELEKKNFKIDKKQIEMIESISSLGYHSVKINLYGPIFAKVKVHVVK